jgi:hypothetical protein
MKKIPKTNQINLWYPDAERALYVRLDIERVKGILIREAAPQFPHCSFDFSLRDGEAVRAALEYFGDKFENESSKPRLRNTEES